jgi:hypothetical protein
MRRHPLQLASFVAVVAALAASCGANSSPSAGGGNAKDQLTKTERAIVRSGSVHFVDVTKIGARSETLTGDIGPTAASERLDVAGSTVLQVVASAGTVYLTTTASSVLQSSLGLTAAQASSLSGKWISLSQSDAPTSSVLQSLTIASALNVYLPKPTSAQLGASTKAGGVELLAIVAKTTPSKNTKESSVLYVSTATSLPATAVLQASQGSTTETKRAVFTKWGRPVTVTVPGTSVPYASLAKG